MEKAEKRIPHEEMINPDEVQGECASDRTQPVRVWRRELCTGNKTPGLAVPTY